MSTKIEWAEETWNPITGCEKVGIECQNCYAQKMAQRLKGRFEYPKKNPFQPGVYHEGCINKPFQWKKPRKIFVCSMGDLFHPDVLFSLIDEVFEVIESNHHHTFLLLTKRPQNMKDYFEYRYQFADPPDNIWCGVTVGLSQPQSLHRLDILSDNTFKKITRFVSIEPMLGSVDLTPYVGWLDWVICGAETGQKARPCELKWVRDLRNQCIVANIPFFFKKFGNGSREIHGQIWEQIPDNNARE